MYEARGICIQYDDVGQSLRQNLKNEDATDSLFRRKEMTSPSFGETGQRHRILFEDSQIFGLVRSRSVEWRLRTRRLASELLVGENPQPKAMLRQTLKGGLLGAW